MEYLLTIALLVTIVDYTRAQGVNINPSIPGIGEPEESIVHRWQFWLAIAIASAFMIVASYFAWRGFRTYFRMKRRGEFAENGENGFSQGVELQPQPSTAAPVPPSIEVDGRGSYELDTAELARRTGRKHSHILAAPPGSGL